MRNCPTVVMKTMLVVFLAGLVCMVYAETNGEAETCERFQRIRIPHVEFRNANAIDVADFLMDATDPEPPFRTSIVLDLSSSERMGGEGPEVDLRKWFYRDLPSVTFALTNATVLEVVEVFARATGVGYAITNGRVVIMVGWAGFEKREMGGWGVAV